MSARFVKIISEAGHLAEVAERSVRVWLDKGWKLVEEEEVAATEPDAVDEADSSEAQTEGTPVEEPRHAAPTPAQPVSGPSKPVPTPAGSGQEA